MKGLKKVYYVDKETDSHKFKYFESHIDANKWIEANKNKIFVELRKEVCKDVRK